MSKKVYIVMGLGGQDEGRVAAVFSSAAGALRAAASESRPKPRVTKDDVAELREINYAEMGDYFIVAFDMNGWYG